MSGAIFRDETLGATAKLISAEPSFSFLPFSFLSLRFLFLKKKKKESQESQWPPCSKQQNKPPMESYRIPAGSPPEEDTTGKMSKTEINN